jgi:DNA repair protein RecO (recombination protein O)
VSAPFVTDAVLLGAVAYGESDRVVTLFTRELGKVGAMARGARKSRSRFGAALSLYVLGEAALRERRGAELLFLESFHAVRDFSGLASDPVRMGHAAYATEIARELTPPHRADPPLLELLVELYEVVARTPPRAGTLRAFELALLGEIGLRPMLDGCVACGDEEADLVDAARGGLVCGRCAGGTALRLLPAAARARLVALRDAGSLAAAAALPPAAAEVEDAARAAMHALVEAHLPRPARSVEFLKKLRNAHG